MRRPLHRSPAGAPSTAAGRLAPPDTRALPPGFRVTLDAGVRSWDGGTVLMGGSPLRILRLTRRGAEIVAGWNHGDRCEDRAELALARRLLDAGMAHPRPGPGRPGRDQVTVVVPARDRPGALARCLTALGARDLVKVVDDASEQPDRIAAVAAEWGAEVIRRGTVGGPGAARNTGLASVTTPYVAFVDSDCRPEPGWLEALLPHFHDPAVAAVAPRVVAEAGDESWISQYDAVRSSLDRGPGEAPVVPRSRVAYVPAAAVVVRRSAVGGGFDEDRLVGEDVDLVWRLWEAGWSVRYEPTTRVRHDPRRTMSGWAARRFRYGTSAAPLESAHPGHVRAVSLSGWSLAAWALAGAGRPDAGLAVVAVASGLMARRLPLQRGRVAEGTRLAGLGTLAVGEGLAATVTQVWWPVALPAAVVSRRARRLVLTATGARLALAWARQRPDLSPARFSAGCLFDDLVYGAGVWWGCLRQRTARPLLPQLTGRIPISRRPA